MGSGSTLKFALCELLQFAGLSVPLIVVMQRFGAIVAEARPPDEARAAYWLILAFALTYVSMATILVWMPLKYMVFTKNRLIIGRRKWRPVALVYVILSTLPCFAFLIASSEVQIHANIRYDKFAELPVSLVVFSLICIDVVERIRNCRLLGRPSGAVRDSEIPSAVPGPGPVTPRQTAPLTSPSTTGAASPPAPAPAPAPAPPPVPPPPTAPVLCACDARSDAFADSFLFWMDTVEMVRVAGLPPVFFSRWALPVYLFCFLSCTRLVVAPHSPPLSPLGVALQDLPFLVLRVGLLAVFGPVTPLLYPMKNLLVCLAFLYFNCMTRLKVFNPERRFL